MTSERKHSHGGSAGDSHAVGRDDASPNQPAVDALASPFDPFLSAVPAPGPRHAQGGPAGGASSVSPQLATGRSAAAGSGLTINITWDSSVSSAPAGFVTGVTAAVQWLEAQFTDPVSISINVGYGEVGGSVLAGGDLGESESYLTSVSYAQLVGALEANAASATDASVLASLPASAPVSGSIFLTTAEAKALKLMSSASTGPDGDVGFSSTSAFTYNNASGVAAGTWDFTGTVLHEITEVMGRMMLNGGSLGATANTYTLLDLLHYSSSGVRDFSGSTPGYFSPDGGVTNLGNFNTVSGGDTGDWASSVSDDSFDAFSTSGVVNAVTPGDLTEMDALGWNLTTAGASATGAPSGISVAAVTGALANAQGRDGLRPATALVSLSQLGGPAGDGYSYALGGPGAGSLTLATVNNTATLSSGTNGLVGSASGTLYAVTVTVTDIASGKAAPAQALNLVVGGAGSDIIRLATLAGIATAAPSFVYGMGANDTIDATGMTGEVYFDGRAGADTMTGGGGGNDYLYGAHGDSTAAAMDVITNFHPASDVIDISALGTGMTCAGALAATATRLAAHSFAWQGSGGNVFVYANTNGSSVALAAASLKIELQGNPALSGANFVHA